MMRTKDKIIVDGVSFYYGTNRVIDNVNAKFKAHAITAITGPSGQGKSTLLGMFNVMWNDTPGARCTGEIQIRLGDRWISPLKKEIPMPLLSRKVAMIFQEPNPLPMSIAKNMEFPLSLPAFVIKT